MVLSEPTYDLFHQWAQARRQDIAEAIADYLAQNPPLLPREHLLTTLESTVDTAMGREKQAYLRLHKQLWEQYADHYVAISGGQLVDHDTDKVALYTRIEQRYPNQFVLMRRVEAAPERTYTFHSLRSLERQP
ncbi:MAG: hypothetical protein R3E79_02590 [Caldilineaceae bacterium]